MAESENRFPERRKNIDRRREPTAPFTKSSLKGSRRYERRKQDRQKNHFVDLYSWRAILLVFMIINLSTLDAFLTLTLINRGIVKEGNPVMAYFLSLGILPFVIIKYFITVICSLTILVLKNHSFRGLISGKRFIVLSLIIYLVIILYEVVLLVMSQGGG